MTISFVTLENNEIKNKNLSFTQNINIDALDNKIKENEIENDMKEMLADSILNQAIQRLIYDLK